jgi:hypothetical protein
MAGRETADIVFCIDASGSMSPTFEAVRAHVFELLDALKGDVQRSWDVRFDFLAYNTAFDCGGKDGMIFKTVSKKNMEVIDGLYKSSYDANGGSSSGFFTTDIGEFQSALKDVECKGDETTAVALDMAADFPFRDATTCHRVIILLTDEKMETGSNVQECDSKLTELAKKLQDRRIALYMITPQSDMFDTLSQIDKCEWTVVNDESNGLSNVDFSKLMQSIGKSVSVSQTSTSASIDPMPLFNENTWTAHDNCVLTDMDA